MATSKSEKEKAKDRRFKENVAVLLKRFEEEMQEARNRQPNGPETKRREAEPPAENQDAARPPCPLAM
jgi:hypothetical protein